MAAPSTALPHAPLSVAADYDLSPADAVWVGTALLHHRQSDRESFTPDEIIASVLDRGLTHVSRTIVERYVESLVVSNRKPKDPVERACMLFAMRDGTRRLYNSLDYTESERRGASTHSPWKTLPPNFAFLEQWYELWNATSIAASTDPLLRLYGSGRAIWADEHADEHVARLREGWDHRP